MKTIVSIGCSRSLIEHQLYQQLRRYPQITFLQGCTVEALCTNEERPHVTGLTR